MRIALIGHHVAPVAPPFAGGVESMTWYLAAGLANRGHEVTLFAITGSAVPGVEVIELAAGQEPSEIALHDVSMPAPEFMHAHRAYQALMIELSASRRRFDVIHSHSLHYLPVLMAEIVPAPMALTLHCPPTPWLEAALAGDRRPGHPTLVAVSAATRDLWNDRAPVAQVIRNGIDLRRWRPGPGGETVFWSGRIVREKAPHLAIDAAVRAGCSIRLAGPIVDEGYWQAEIQPRLGERVRYLGHLTHERLAAEVRASGVLVVTPMWEEPFCLSAAEAIASGTPVAGFARGGLPEVVGECAGVLTMPGDIDGLASSIGLAFGLSRDAVRLHAQRTLALERVITEHEELYERLAAARTRTRSSHAWWRRRAPVAVPASASA